MDGVVLSETGLNTIKQALPKTQPKRQHTNQRKLSDPPGQTSSDSGCKSYLNVHYFSYIFYFVFFV